MYVPNAEITIGGKRFRRVNSVEIESDSKKLEDTAIIKIPTTARLERAGEFVTEIETRKEFKVGDEVEIKLGYDGEYATEFHGYVRKIRPNTPLEILCEDATFLLKRKNLQGAFRDTNLKSLMDFILDGTGISLAGEPPTVNFTHFYFRNVSAAKALAKLKSEYGLTMYFKDIKTLYVGLSSDNDGTVVGYKMGENVIDNDLEWQDESDVKLTIKAVNVRPDNTQTSVEVGDADGEKRTLFFYDLEDVGELETRAKEEILKYKYSGYKGSLTTLLVPVCRVGNVAKVIDPNFPGRDGNYLIEKTRVSYGSGGGRRVVALGIKVNV